MNLSPSRVVNQWGLFLFLTVLAFVSYFPSARAGTLSVTNGSFTNLTGLTGHGGGWYGGIPEGWSTATTPANAYTVLNSGGTYYANLQQLGGTAPFAPLRQNVGTVDITSDVTLTFTLNTLSGASTLGSAIYDLALPAYTSALSSYSSGSITSPSTVSYTARGVGPGTALYIAFWNGSSAAGISGVSIADSATTYAWNGGVSGAWTNGGGGWTDKFDNTAATYNNAKPVVVQFTNASAGTNVSVAAGGVNVGNIQVSGANYDFSGGTITMTNTTWSVGANATNTVASALAGTTGLTKSDTGTLALGASNNYTGTTAINDGTLTIADGNALGSTADGTTVASGAQLRLTATNSGFTVGNEALTISGDGVAAGGALRSTAGTNTYQGKITLAADATIGVASGSTLVMDVASGNAIEASNRNLTFVGAGTNLVNDAISLGTGAIIKTGSGLAVLSASNSYSGGTTISNGTLRVGVANALGSGALTVNGGTLDLGGNNLTAANLSGTGGTISLGTNTLTASMSSGGQFSGAISGSGGLVKTGASLLTLAGSNSYAGGTALNAGTLYVIGSGTLGDTAGTITISNAVLDLRNQQTRTGTITMIGQDARLISGDVNNPGSVVNNGSALQFGGGLISASISGTGGLNVTGGGSLNASNSFTGDVTISGTDGWYGANSLFVANAHGLGAVSNNVTMSGGFLSLQNNTITRSGNLTIIGGTVQTGTFDKSGSDYDIQGGNINVVLAGTAGLTKSSTNGASLNASNTYTGNTTISAGTLQVGGTLGDAAGAVTVNGSGSGSTYVTLDLRSQQTRTGAISMTNQDARIISGNGLGSIVNNGGAFQFGGGSLEVAVSGSGGMNITGGGRMTASNSYTGATVISATAGWYGTGQFFTESAHALGAASGALTVSGGTLNLYSNTITRSGNLTISGGTVANGTLSKSGTAYDIQGGSIAAVLAGTAGLTKSGAGTATLSGSNTYSGATVVSTGTLQVASAGSISSSSTTVNSGGTLDVDGTAGAVTINNGGTLKGDGTVSALTIASGGNLAPGNSTGTLNVGNTTFLAGGKYSWEIDDFSGTVGTSWDFLNITGDLDITAGTAEGSQFLIDVVSLLAATDTSGAASNFTDSLSYSFAIATASGAINNYDSGKFLINTAGFQNAFTGTWGTSLSGDGKSLNITYTAATAIPEPSTGVLFLSALGILGLRRRFSVR